MHDVAVVLNVVICILRSWSNKLHGGTKATARAAQTRSAGGHNASGLLLLPVDHVVCLCCIVMMLCCVAL